MELTFTTFLIICPMVFLAGFVDAIGGGGGLISLPAYLMAGLPPHMAVATNKCSSAIGTLVSTVKYCLSGCVDWPLAIPGFVASYIGAQVGSRLALLVSASVFKIMLLVMLPVICAYMIFRRQKNEEIVQTIARKKQFIIVGICSLIIGFYDGFYGPGTGTFLILAYTSLAKMTTLTASGNMKLANLASNISALVVFLINGAVLLPLGLTAAVFSIGGHYLGASLAIKHGAKIVRLIMIFVIVLLFVTVLLEVLGIKK